MPHCTGTGVCRLQETLPVGNRCLSQRIWGQKQDDRCYHLVAYAGQGLKGGELKYHSSKLEFLALKWAITNQFKEYLQNQPFQVKTNINPLTYVMTMPNLDAVRHRWVAAMAGYNFDIEYIHGTDNKVADALCWVGGCLDKDTVKELLSHATCFGIPMSRSQWSIGDRGAWQEGEIIMQVRMLVQAKENYRNLANSHWVVACGDLAIWLVTKWLKRRKDDHRTLDQYLKHQIPNAECWIYVAFQKDFTLWRNLLYLRTTLKRSNDNILAFIFPGLKCQASIDGCHHYLGHQGRDRILSLLRERFWWPGMAQRMMMSIHNCNKCHIFEVKP